MNVWQSVSIVLGLFLGVSYIGFALVFSQNWPLNVNIGPTVTQGMEPKVVTILQNANITFPTWNASVDVLGYKTGFVYLMVFQVHPRSVIRLRCDFETDDIHAFRVGSSDVSAGQNWANQVNLCGSRIWFHILYPYTGPPTSGWAIVSLSLYLRD